MPHFNLRHFMETLGSQRGSEVFVLEIGAMDGKSFDPMHEYISRYDWSAVLVEPVAEQFAKLQANFAGNPQIRCVNTAIAEKIGSIAMHRITDAVAAENKLPAWAGGAASLYPDRNALAFEKVREFVILEEVPCTTLPELIRQQNIQKIDILQIDAEGHDYHILRQLDFSKFHPAIIHLEIVNLPKAEQTACKRLLDEQRYLHIKAGYNLLAVSLKYLRDEHPE